MFAPKRMPKEGRSLPGLPYAGGPAGKSRFGQRQAVLIILVILCIPLLYYFTHTDISAGPVVLGGANTRSSGHGDQLHNTDSLKKPESKADGGKVLIPEVVKDDSPPPPPPPTKKPTSKPISVVPSDDNNDDDPVQKPVQKSPPKAQSEAQKHVAADKGDEGDDDESDELVVKRPSPKPSESTKKHQQGPNAEKWAERPEFEEALASILQKMPGEVYMRELTRPVDVTGKDRLREMALRVRNYKEYLEAWEKLHLVEDDEGSVYVRDDVLQYLRSHQHKLLKKGSTDKTGLAGRSLGEIMRTYEGYRAFLLRFANLLFPWTMPYFSDHMALHAHFKKGGRGIVLTAGDDQAPYLLTTIPTFRQLGCNLPIEVMYLGDSDLGEDYRMQLEELDGVVTRDIAQMVNDHGWKLAGWAAKPFAILLSSFREVIFIDADSLFFRDPETLFDEPGYKKTGALFFKDRLIMPESKRRWLQQILPAPIPKKARETRFWSGDSGHQQESGVVVVDKWKHMIPLLLVTRMNGPDRDGNKEKGIVGVYDMVYGDKETFWVGWLLSGSQDYHFHEGDAGIMGVVKDPEDHSTEPNHEDDKDAQLTTTKGPKEPENYTICAPQLLHLDTDGKPYWFNGWLLDNKFADRNKKKFAQFKSYLIEPKELREPGAWTLAESNMCCLTSDADKKFDFAGHDLEVIEMVMERARKNKAFGNQ